MRRGGRVVYYGRERQGRYDALRNENFTKNESRTLSRISHPADRKVLSGMVSDRRRMMRAFELTSELEGWSANQRRYHYYRGIRNWYQKQGFAGKGNPVMAWYNKVENRLASNRGWRKGVYDPALAPDAQETEMVRRRTKKRTPLRGRVNKGQIEAQKARAKAKKQYTRARGNVGKLRIDILEREVANAPQGIVDARDPAIRKNLIARKRLLVGRLERARATGADYG